MGRRGLVKAKLKLWDRFGPVCQGCFRMFDYTELTLDHIRPKCKGGHVRSVLNLQLMCEQCNFDKGDDWDGVSGLVADPPPDLGEDGYLRK